MSSSSKTYIEEHGLVASAWQAARLANARRVLLVSAHSGDGKTHFTRCVLRHWSTISDYPVRIETFPFIEPSSASESVIWIDGLALMEGQGPSALSPRVRGSIDAALFIARGMVTTRAEAAECADRLSKLDVPLLGGIWNEFDCAPVDKAVRKIWSNFFSWPPRFPHSISSSSAERSSS